MKLFPGCLATLLIAGTAAGQFAYVTNTSTVAGYRMNPATGALTPVVASPFATAEGAYGVAADPQGRFLYVACRSGVVSGFRIHPDTGGLTELPGSPYAAGSDPHGVVVDPAGHYVYVANAGSMNVSPTGSRAAAP